MAEASQAPPHTDTRQKRVRGDDHQALDETAEGEVGERAEEYKECISDSVIAARQATHFGVPGAPRLASDMRNSVRRKLLDSQTC